MASAALISLAEYLTTPYEPDCEYVDGELLDRNVGETDHSGLQGLLAARLFQRRKELGIHVFPATRTQVSARRFRVPDIAVTTYKPKGRILTEPPFLCIEVLSPEDRASRIEDRIDDYLAFGVRHVWIIDPRKRRAWSYTAEGRRDTVDVLTTDNPRIELPINELFEELDEEVQSSD